jgi:hypothetical protein
MHNMQDLLPTGEALQEIMKYLSVLTNEYTYETDEFRVNSTVRDMKYYKIWDASANSAY